MSGTHTNTVAAVQDDEAEQRATEELSKQPSFFFRVCNISQEPNPYTQRGAFIQDSC